MDSLCEATFELTVGEQQRGRIDPKLERKGFDHGGLGGGHIRHTAARGRCPWMAALPSAASARLRLMRTREPSSFIN